MESFFIRNNIVDRSTQKQLLKALSHYRKCSYSDLIFDRDVKLMKEEGIYLESVYLRLKKNEPLTKILGVSSFYGRDFFINHHVLDPRPDSECLIDTVLCLKKEMNRFLDLGTGSGCLLITLLLEYPTATGVAVDLSDEALDIAKKNAQHHMVQDRLTFIKSNWYDNLPFEKFDCIISNPPYIEKTYQLDSSVLDYDPHLALFGGTDGLDCYRSILKGMNPHLKNDGFFICEIGYNQKESLIEESKNHSFLHYEKCVKDLSNNDRVLVFRKNKSKQSYIYFSTLPSTQVYARDHSFLQDTLIRTFEQTKGLAQRGRVWDGVKGNFFGTFVLKNRKHLIENIHHYSFVSGIACVRYFKKIGFDHLSLKWPNDIYNKDCTHKMGGILCEINEGDLLIGIGLNLFYPSHCKTFLSTSFFDERANLHHFSSADFFDTLISTFDEYDNNGFLKIKDEWLQYCGHMNKFIQLSDGRSGVFKSISDNADPIFSLKE